MLRADRALGPSRVLFLNDTSRSGGPGRTLYFLLKFMDPAAVHRLVVVPREGFVAELLREPGVAEAVVLEPGLIENPVEPWGRALQRRDFGAPRLLRVARAIANTSRAAAGMARLAALVRRERIRAIFCNGTSSNFAGAALAAATGVPAVWHAFYTQLAPPLRPLHRMLAASRGVRSVLCVSEPVARLFDHCEAKVRVVHDAIDLDAFAPGATRPRLRAELGFGPDDVVFGSQGRILPRKGYAEMVRAARLALDRLAPGERRRCRFAVLGDTPEDTVRDHLAECRRLVQDLGMEERFSFLGHRVDVRPYAVDFDVVVVPSVYEDPLPRAVLEGMALAKPVIAFDVGGIGEAVVDGVTGALVPAPDVDRLALALVRYFRDPDLRRRHGEAGRARAEASFSARRHALEVQRLILEAAGAAA